MTNLYAAAPSAAERETLWHASKRLSRALWLAPSTWFDTGLDAIDALDIDAGDVVDACVDALTSGDDPRRPVETAVFRVMVTRAVTARRMTIRQLIALEQQHIADVERGIAPLALKRAARGDAPLWCVAMRRGERVWVRNGER